jgi:hypothetical protein
MLKKLEDFLFSVPESYQAGFLNPAGWALVVCFVFLAETRVLHHL